MANNKVVNLIDRTFIKRVGVTLFTFLSSNGVGKYFATVVNGKVECECKGFQYRATCKHTDYIAQNDYTVKMHEHNARAAAQEYRIVERVEFGDFIPEYRCLATGWETFLDTRPAVRDLALSVRCETHEEAVAFLAKQPAVLATYNVLAAAVQVVADAEIGDAYEHMPKQLPSSCRHCGGNHHSNECPY